MNDRQEELEAFLATAKRYAAWLDKRSREQEWAEAALRRNPAEFDWEAVREAHRAGLLYAVLPEELGGSGVDLQAQALLIEGVAQGRAGLAEVLSVHWSALRALSRLEGAAEWAMEIASREDERPALVGLAYARSVIDNDDDPAEAKVEEPGLTVSGELICPLHPELCERVVMVVPTDEGEAAIWVAESQLAPSTRETFPGSGLLEVPMAAVKLEALSISREAVMDEAAPGIIRTSYYQCLAAAMVGNARAAATYAREYAHERVQTGRPIIGHQDVLRVLESMEVRLDAAWSVVVQSSREGGLEHARRAYLAAGDAMEAVGQDAVQTLGGYGYMKDYGLEMRLRDLKTLQCLTGAYAREVIGESF